MNRDFRLQAKLVYRACRMKYGPRRTNREFERVAAIVYQEWFSQSLNPAPYASVPIALRNKLYAIFRSWRPRRELAALVLRAEAWLEIPMECDKEDLITFYEEILTANKKNLAQ